MPVQTNLKSYIYFPDGCKVEAKESADAEYIDIGAISSAVTSTLNWTESSVETANAGTLDTKISKMEMSGGFTLINLNPIGIKKLGGGVFIVEEIPGTAIAAGSSQTIAAGWEAGVIYPMVFGSNNVKAAEKPTITSITPEGESALVANTDYVIVETDNSDSGFGIVFITDTKSAKALTVVYGAITPVAQTQLSCGNSSVVLRPYMLRFTHTDDDGKKRQLELPYVYSNSGGFQFNFKGANEDGVEEMPITYTARIDSSRVNNKQLMTWSIEE